MVRVVHGISPVGKEKVCGGKYLPKSHKSLISFSKNKIKL